MPTNPFTDVWHFLTATTSDYLHQGNWRYLILALFWALLLASIAVAFRNWQEDSEQRSGRHLGVWLFRVLIGCMWFRVFAEMRHQSLTVTILDRADRPAQLFLSRTFAKDVVLLTEHPGPIIFLAELAFAASMMLGHGAIGDLLTSPMCATLADLYDNRPSGPGHTCSWRC
jgi:hypothetical protein